MKATITFFFGIFIIISMSNCANGQKITEEAPVAFQQAYYTPWVGGVKGSGAGYNLFIPVNGEMAEVQLDSVYFRGKKAKLTTKPQNDNLYIGHFETSSGTKKAPDLVMSSDPREEYGNQAPEIIRDFPFELKEDEAVVSFRKEGKTSYFKISNIQKRDSDVKINYPDNIQH
ncbi:hypothetical protein [Salinimicrobium sp. GXAS 041]|uniref:hypothetical protein n=1 Tax=Salinimicrobium sp. GXAS 041 TaxID=3400806 RepID=UPI003C792BCE